MPPKSKDRLVFRLLEQENKQTTTTTSQLEKQRTLSKAVVGGFKTLKRHKRQELSSIEFTFNTRYGD